MRANRRLLCLLLPWVLAVLPGCRTLFFGTLNSGHERPAETIEYAAGRRLDLYRPSGHTPAPVVVFFYGGRWQDGRRSEYAFVGEQLAAHGVLAIVADYRTWPKVQFPTFVDDAAAAVGWVAAHAGDYGGDPDRLFVAGHSAGAHIAALLGTDGHYLAAVGLHPADLAGVIGIAGPYDFLPLTDDDLQAIFGPERRWPDSQPVGFVDGDEPPFLLLHGDDDRLVWPRNSASLAQRLCTAGDRVRYIRYPDLGHLRILAALRYPHLAPTLADVLAFVHDPAGDTAGGCR